MRRIGSFLKSHFLTGLLILVPIVVTVWIFRILLTWLFEFYNLMPSAFSPEPGSAAALFLKFAGGLVIMLALVLIISFLGFLSRLYVGQKCLEVFRDLVEKIPILGTIYTSIEQLMKAIASGRSKQFSSVVYFEYPRKGIWSLAFVTGESKSSSVPEDHLNVFVPTVPNPTSGFYLIVPKSDVRDSQLTVEQAFKVILSVGMAQPRKKTELK